MRGHGPTRLPSRVKAGILGKLVDARERLAALDEPGRFPPARRGGRAAAAEQDGE